MMMTNDWKCRCLVTLLLIPGAFAGEQLLQRWYPTYGTRIRTIVEEDCQWQMDLYYSDFRPANCTEDTACKIDPAVDCILDNMRESDKANMAAAAVVLGLLPTTLGLAGSTTTETGMLSLRRPFLALLLAASAPAVNPIRTFEYRDPVRMLHTRTGTWKISHPPTGTTNPSRLWSAGIVSLQYVVAIAAVFNLFWISWTMAHMSICSWAPELGWLPVAWACLSIAIHFAGAISVALRMKFVNTSPVSKSESLWIRLRNEVTPSARISGQKVRWKPEGWIFYILSWLTSTGTVLHIIFGTLIFSSILFIATADAVGVVAQYLASAVVSRIILNYELDGISYGTETALEEEKWRSRRLPRRPEGQIEMRRMLRKMSTDEEIAPVADVPPRPVARARTDATLRRNKGP